MSEVVLDASALLALLLGELQDGAEELLDGAVLSAVNLTEVWTKLIDLERLDPAQMNMLLALGLRVEPFTADQAILASELRSSTRDFGLSLGDRACLALGLQLGLEVYTCDQIWSKLNVGCNIRQLRKPLGAK